MGRFHKLQCCLEHFHFLTNITKKKKNAAEGASNNDLLHELMGFPGGSDGKESACNAGDQGSVLGL